MHCVKCENRKAQENHSRTFTTQVTTPAVPPITTLRQKSTWPNLDYICFFLGGLVVPYLGLGSTYLGGHDDFVVGPTQDRYYLDPDVRQKCEELRTNQPLFLVTSVRRWTRVESILPRRTGSIEIEVP